MIAAAAAGGLVGLNRDLAGKPMGARTLALVSLGAATVGVAGIQVPGLAEDPDALSRVVQCIIQGVMAGISFIGAGVILRNAEARTVEGLTTAASVWVTAALGVACGLGAWRTIAIAIPVTLVTLLAAGWIDRFRKRNGNNERMEWRNDLAAVGEKGPSRGRGRDPTCRPPCEKTCPLAGFVTHPAAGSLRRTGEADGGGQ